MLTSGTATVTATLEGVSAVSTIVVTDAELVAINVDPPVEQVPAGTEVQYQATGVFSDNTTSPINEVVTWQSGNTAVATITAEGTHVLEATATD